MGKGKIMLSKYRSEKAAENRKKHGIIHMLAFVAIVVSVIFVGYTIITKNIEIRNNKRQLDELVAQTEAMKAKNEQIRGYLENSENLEKYIEQIARDKLDFANSDERIYYVIPAGN